MNLNYMKKNKPIRIIRHIIIKCAENATGSNKAELQSWLDTSGTLERFHNNIKKEQEVTTLLFPESPKKISQFYYPLKINSTINDKPTTLEDLINSGPIQCLINGRLGQGKSMLLKYLQFIVLNKGESLPIFIELRKIKSHSDLLDSARKKLISLGLLCSERLFKHLISNSLITLMYDGFDEIPLEQRDLFNTAFETIAKQYPNTKIFVTSRHDTEISKNKFFKSFNICRLTTKEIPPFIERIIHDEQKLSQILSKIKESKDFDFEVLDSPILITWFIIVYNKRLKIPKTKLGFYEDLFVAILTRHDGMKESYDRATKSKLSDDEIKKVFCAFCFLSRGEQDKYLNESYTLELIQKSLNICEFKNTKASDYLYDLTHVTCLLKRERDGDYQFIHESISQYFSACFIKDAEEENAKLFYTNRVEDWRIREGELNFLSSIDEIRYTRYFYIESLDLILKSKEGISKLIFSSSVLAFESRISDTDFGKFATVLVRDGFHFVLKEMSEFTGPFRVSSNNFFEKNIAGIFDFNKLGDKKKSIYRGEIFAFINLYTFIREMRMIDQFEKSMFAELTPILIDKRSTAQIKLTNERKKGSLFE